MKSLTERLPRASSEEHAVQYVGEELVIFCKRRNIAFSLERDCAAVYSLCDGESTIGQAAEKISSGGNEAIESAINIVYSCLARLDQDGLVQTQGWTRRQFAQKLAGAAIAAPVVASVLIPTAAAAATNDFAVSAFSQNGPVTIGNTITFTGTVQYDGTGARGTSQFQIFLTGSTGTTSPTITGAATSLGGIGGSTSFGPTNANLTVPSDAGGASFSGTFSITVTKPDVGTGSYQLILLSGVPDSVPGNNQTPVVTGTWTP